MVRHSHAIFYKTTMALQKASFTSKLISIKMLLHIQQSIEVIK